MEPYEGILDVETADVLVKVGLHWIGLEDSLSKPIVFCVGLFRGSLRVVIAGRQGYICVGSTMRRSIAKPDRLILEAFVPGPIRWCA